MIFIGIALIFAMGLGLILIPGAPDAFGLTQQQMGQLVPLLMVLIIVAGGAFGRTRPLGEILGNVVAWIVVFGVLFVGYAYRNEIVSVADRVIGEFTPGAAVISPDGTSATFSRSMGGSFRVNAEINGAPVPMIFDTGASAVVLTLEDAEAAGIDTRALRFTIPVQTANGQGRAAATMLDTISVGGIARRRVRAFIAENNALETSLLGMTYLETLSGYGVSRDTLQLHN